MSHVYIHEISPPDCPIYVDPVQGLLSVSHDGTITWDQLQSIKNAVWGEDVRAIEVYPAQSQVINSAPIRHLWRLGPNDFCPDLMGDDGAQDSLQSRFTAAWAEARS